MKRTMVGTVAISYDDTLHGTTSVASFSERVSVVEDAEAIAHRIDRAIRGEGPAMLRLTKTVWNGATSEHRPGGPWWVAAAHVIDLDEVGS